MFNRFTEQARRAILLAREEAKRLDHDYLGTEHILLGLIREGEGVGARALQNLGLDLARVRQQVEKAVGRGSGVSLGELPFSPRAKKALELAVAEARNLEHNLVGTEHLLLGLIREGKGAAAQTLIKLGADVEKVRNEVLNLLKGGRRAETVEKEKYPLTQEECLKIGGHCYVQEPEVIMTNPPIYHRTCKHCGKRQECRIQHPIEWHDD